MYRHILIPTDGTERSHRAAQHGIDLAKAVGAKVTALTVEPTFNVFTLTHAHENTINQVFDDYTAQAKVHAARILDAVAAAAKAAGVACETVQVENDHPHDAIIDTAKKKGCDLIVMASHGRSGVSAVVIGSVTNKVMTHTDIPVLVCH
jgi:nucleotide-binding universal stress UspA family protein